ncbi:hypothetical protein [Paraburkholderia aspalathi]
MDWRRAIVEPGVHIATGAVVAAGTHVTTNIGKDEIVIGCPQRVLCHRNVIEDGSPNFDGIISIVRARLRTHKDMLPPGWISGEVAFLDADLSGGHGVNIGRSYCDREL